MQVWQTAVSAVLNRMSVVVEVAFAVASPSYSEKRYFYVFIPFNMREVQKPTKIFNIDGCALGIPREERFAAKLMFSFCWFNNDAMI